MGFALFLIQLTQLVVLNFHEHTAHRARTRKYIDVFGLNIFRTKKVATSFVEASSVGTKTSCTIVAVIKLHTLLSYSGLTSF